MVFVLLLSVHGIHQKNNNQDLCDIIEDILCVKDVLTTIVKAAKNIHTMAMEIEHKTWKHDPNTETLGRTINITTLTLASKFPKLDHHKRLLYKNNFDKYDLIELIKEEHYAVTYLYYSVKNLHSTKSTLAADIKDLLDRIQQILQTQMICNYRNILRVYSEVWIPVHHTDTLQLPTVRKRELPSITYHTYSIIIARLLHRWMDYIEKHLNAFDTKIV